MPVGATGGTGFDPISNSAALGTFPIDARFLNFVSPKPNRMLLLVWIGFISSRSLIMAGAPKEAGAIGAWGIEGVFSGAGFGNAAGAVSLENAGEAGVKETGA
jgi:hypothetical protein